MIIKTNEFFINSLCLLFIKINFLFYHFFNYLNLKSQIFSKHHNKTLKYKVFSFLISKQKNKIINLYFLINYFIINFFHLNMFT